MDETGLEQARAKLGEIIEQARLKGRPTVITRYGRPAAVIVGWQDAVRAGLAPDAEPSR